MNGADWKLANYRNVSIGTARVAFFDARTGEELYYAGYMGNDETGIRDGQRYVDTTFAVDAVDLETRIGGRVTPECFPGRKVLVKLWRGPKMVEIKALISRADGWLGNESAECNSAPMTGSVGALAMYRRFAVRSA